MVYQGRFSDGRQITVIARDQPRACLELRRLLIGKRDVSATIDLGGGHTYRVESTPAGLIGHHGWPEVTA